MYVYETYSCDELRQEYRQWQRRHETVTSDAYRKKYAEESWTLLGVARSFLIKKDADAPDYARRVAEFHMAKIEKYRAGKACSNDS